MASKKKRVKITDKQGNTFVTLAQQSLFRDVQEVIKKEDFLKTINNLRKEWDIPQQGFPGNTYEVDSIVDGPFFAGYPNRWKYEKNIESRDKIDKKLKQICKQFHLLPLAWLQFLRTYLFYNRDTSSEIGSGFADRILVAETASKISSLLHKEEEAEFINAFPVVLYISPGAKITNLKDYLDRYFDSVIEPLLNKHTKAGGVTKAHRSKDLLVQERNDFVISLRRSGKTYKEISEEVRKKFPGQFAHFGVGHVGKVISRWKEENPGHSL